MWLWGGFGGALVEPWGSLGVALGWLCTPESMPSICLLYGFVVALGGFTLADAFPGWPRRDRLLSGTMNYIPRKSGAANTISYSDTMPAQPVEIKQLVQSAQLTPATILRCR